MSTNNELPASDLCHPFLAVVPADGASVSILAGAHGQSTISASDPTSARLDEIQFDLGEGPCWTAMSTRRPVLPSSVEDDSVWPVFSEALRNDESLTEVASVYAFPMVVGSLDIGAVDFWSTTVDRLSATEVEDLSELASLAAWQVLRHILADESNDRDDADLLSLSRREVHQATGMVLAQLDVTAADAALLIRAHAFSTGRTVREVANDVLARRIHFSAEGAA